MKICISICGTVCRDEQFCPVKIRCLQRCQFDLDRPVTQLGFHCRTTLCHNFCVLRPVHLTHSASWASSMGNLHTFPLHLFLLFQLLCLFYCRLIIGRRLPLFKSDGSRRTSRQAVTEAIAEMLSHQLCLAVNNIYRTLVTCGRTNTTTIAFFFINMNDFSNHVASLILLFSLSLRIP